MKRFLLVLALVSVAGATYAATAPGSQTAGPTAKQFRALQKQVSTLKKQVKTANGKADLLATITFKCMLHTTLGVAQRGDPGGTYGYTYTNGSPSMTTALDLSATPTTTLLTLNPDPDCASLVGLASRGHTGGLARWARLHR